MAHLHRIALTLLFCLPMFLAGREAHAYPATRTNPDTCTTAPCYEYTTRSWSSTANQEPWLPTQDAACQRALQDMKNAYASSAGTGGDYDPNFFIVSIQGGNSCFMRDSRDSFPNATWGIASRSVSPATPIYSCPAGGTLSGSNCVCDAGQTDTGTSCTAPPPKNDCADLATASTPAGEYSGKGSIGTYKVCDTAGVSSSGDPALPGCVVSIDANFAVGPEGSRIWVGRGVFTGAKCSPDPGVTTPDSDGGNAPGSTQDNGAPAKCPPGKVPGTVNGTNVCVDPGTSDPTQTKGASSNTTTNPDGSTTTTGQQTTTTCTGAICTTTTTTTVINTPAGGGTGTTETTTSTGTCTRGSPGCGDEDTEPSRFGGSCAAFACDGDAIMCAVALEQHKRNCQLFVTTSAESDLYESEKGKTGPQYTSEPSVNIGPGSINQTNPLAASAQCISDKTVTVAGNTITLPFSQICSTLQHLGTVLLFIAFLTAYRIVSGR